MITIGFSTREDNQKHIDHLTESCGLDKKHIQIIEIVNPGIKSLSQCYNEILDQSENEIIVYSHDDVFLPKNWGNKIIKHFRRNPEYGIIGCAGTKLLKQSGMWWENPKTMYGQVYHTDTQTNKTWLSAYSKDQGNKLENVVLVDGVFFAINKNKIKERFDESVSGFHFYDITFCVKNYLAGIKIGVFTDVKIRHLSLGKTNEIWESNRAIFAETYKEYLPLKIKKVFDKNNKIKVLIGCLNFNSYTGSELYFYELAKELIKQGCEVSICSNLIGGDLAKRASSFGIKLYNLNEPPGYKLGDGKWLLKTPNGDIPSKENTLYAVSPVNFDILHLSHKPIVEHMMKLYPDVPVISTIHSEVLELEYPVINDRIKKYIAIRPEIKQFSIDRFEIAEDKIEVIYNPIDNSRFKNVPTKKRDKRRVVSVSTLDYLRQNMIIDLIETTKLAGEELYLVGKNNGIKLDQLLVGQDHVKYFPATWHVEKYIQECDVTSGILLGRSTIESWFCGKPSIIYDIDAQGTIKSKQLFEVPNDIDKFYANNVAGKIIEEYKKIIE